MKYIVATIRHQIIANYNLKDSIKKIFLRSIKLAIFSFTDILIRSPIGWI